MKKSDQRISNSLVLTLKITQLTWRFDRSNEELATSFEGLNAERACQFATNS